MVTLLVVSLLLRLFVINFYTIPQDGMYPGLPAGSRFWAVKRPYRSAADVRRGDVVLFDRQVGGSGYTLVWRVIGLPGDRVALVGDSVSINGVVLTHVEIGKTAGATLYNETNGDSSYPVAYDSAPSRARPMMLVNVPRDEFFVMGDNRDNARDSRFDGTVPFRSIFARKVRP
jgi:signal peptidase I